MNNLLRCGWRVGGSVGSFLALFIAVGAWAQTQPAAGTLKVKVVDEAGKPLPARVHLRDATGRYLLAAGQQSRQRSV